ncbi:MAG: hypothetical protein H0V01_05500 [Bacteroidetes bacterium]|nr:hypothetical protein [Bacteroidota bacterium]HET6243623.1 hypothetical protein [Bacteroidia bacterium]
MNVQDKNEIANGTENKWTAHLVPIGGRKCIYFIHKKSLYSVLVIDILKKDLKELNNLFYEAFVTQLKVDKIYNSEFERFLKENFSSMKLFSTDNDQKTMGTMRDGIMHLKSFCEEKENKLDAAVEFCKYSLNRIPIGTRKFKYAKELMEEELKTTANIA